MSEDYALARKQFLAAARDRSDFIEPRLMLAGLSLRERQPAEALSWSEQALNLDPQNSRARFYRAIAATQIRRFDVAKSDLETLQRRFPDSSDVKLQMGVMALAEGRNQDAQRILTGLDVSKEGVVEALSESFVRQGAYHEALEALNSRVEAEPQSVALLATFAAVLDLAGRHDEAAKAYERVTQQHPEDASLRLKFGASSARSGQIDAAKVQFEKARELAPNKAAPLITLAMTHEGSGEVETAIDYYERALRVDANNVLASNNLAFLLADTGQAPQRAVELAQAAVHAAPRIPAFRDTLGWSYYKAGQIDSAIQVFRALANESPEEGRFHGRLGLVLADAAKRRRSPRGTQSGGILGRVGTARFSDPGPADCSAGSRSSTFLEGY